MADLSTMTDEELQAALAKTPVLRRDLPKAPAEMSDDELRAAIAGNTVTAVDAPASEHPYQGLTAPDASGAFVPSSMAHGITSIPKFLADQVARRASIGNPFDMTNIAERIDADRARGQATTNWIEEKSQEIAPFMKRLPETPGERVLDALIQGAITGPLGPGAKGATLAETGIRVASNMAIGGAAGAAAGGAGELLPESTPEAVRLGVMTGAGMLGGGAAGVAAPWSTAPRTVLEGSIRSPEEAKALIAAAMKAKEARAAGIPMNTMDFVEGPPSRLHDIQQSLVTLGEGEQTLRNIHNQPKAIQAEANRFREDTPGRVVAPEEVGRDWQQAATDELVGKKKAAVNEFGTTVDQARADSLEAAKADATLSEAQVADAARGKGALDDTADKVDRMAQNDIDEAQRAANKQQEKDNTATLATAAGEVVRNSPTIYHLKDLGPDGVRANARLIEIGKPQQDTFTAKELRDLGITEARMTAMTRETQPVTKGEGQTQQDMSPPVVDENSPGVHPFVKDAKAAATDLRNEGETILNTAEHRYETDLARIEGNEALKPSAIRQAQNRITRMIEENKGKDSIIPDLIHIRDRIGSVTTAKELHNLITDLKNTLPSTKALEPASRNKALTENAVVGPAINGPLKDLRNSAAPAYAKADVDYAKAMEELNKTKTTTLLGEIAGPKGAAPDKLAAKGRVDAILDAHDSANMEGNSFRKPTLAAIGRQNPDALANGVATWFDKHLSRIFGESDVAQPNAEAGKQGTRFLGDESNPLNDARIKGTHDIFDSVADAQRMPAPDRAAMHRGLDNLRSLFNAGSRAPTRATQVSQQELLDAMSNLGKFEALGIAGIMPGKAVLRIVRPTASKKNFAKLDELFSNPDKVHQLIELGKIPKYTYAQRVRIMSLVGALMAENSRQLQTGNNRQSEEEPK